MLVAYASYGDAGKPSPSASRIGVFARLETGMVRAIQWAVSRPTRECAAAVTRLRS